MILDVDRAISASELGGLAWGIILASLLISLLTVILFSGRTRNSNSNAKLTQSVRVFTNFSLITGVLAGFVGLFATYINQETLKEASFIGNFTNDFGLWLIGSLLFLVILLLLLNGRGEEQLRSRFKSPLSVSLLVVLAISLLLPLELLKPTRSVEAVGKTSSGVTVTVVMSPGAVGSNTLKLGLTGSDVDVARVFSYVIDGKAQISLTTGESNSDTQQIKLKISEEGSLVADQVIAKFSGKSKIRFKWSKSKNSLTMPINLQENPGYNP